MPQPYVSIVMPVYNAADVIDACLNSLLRQSIGFNHLEVVAVDDGSTDESRKLLEEFGRGRPNVVVMHQPNSGGAGRPRNVAIARSSGKYVFPVDPDDYLGDEAIERMYSMGERNNADVVVGKIVGIGRRVAKSPWRQNWERADIVESSVYNTITSLKMFRRAFVVQEDLQFVEGVKRGEELVFVTAALLRARTISVLSDYDCYYAVERGGGNLSRSPFDPESFFAILRDAVAEVDRYATNDDVRTAFYRRFVRNQLLPHFGQQWLTAPPERRRVVFSEASKLTSRLCQPDVVSPFPTFDRVCAHLLLTSQLEALEEFVRLKFRGEAPPLGIGADGISLRLPGCGEPTLPAHALDALGEVTSATWSANDNLKLAGTGGIAHFAVTVPLARSLEIRRRRSEDVVRVRLDEDSSPTVGVDAGRPWCGQVDVGQITVGVADASLWDIWLVVDVDGHEIRSRLTWGVSGAWRSMAFVDERIIAAYRTTRGLLSIDGHVRPDQVASLPTTAFLTSADWRGSRAFEVSCRITMRTARLGPECSVVLHVVLPGGEAVMALPMSVEADSDGQSILARSTVDVGRLIRAVGARRGPLALQVGVSRGPLSWVTPIRSGAAGSVPLADARRGKAGNLIFNDSGGEAHFLLRGKSSPVDRLRKRARRLVARLARRA